VANQVFNISLGFWKRYAQLPAANDALVVELFKVAEADGTLRDRDDLAAVKANNTVANFTNYAKREITASITITVDDTNDRLDVDIPDQVWTAAGGALNNSLVKFIFCYDDDTTSGTDTNIVPISHHDFVVTTDGSDLTAQIAAAGILRAA
jgi:hypothetical protein